MNTVVFQFSNRTTITALNGLKTSEAISMNSNLTWMLRSDRTIRVVLPDFFYLKAVIVDYVKSDGRK